MKQVVFPYGKDKLIHQFEDGELMGVLTSQIEEYIPKADEHSLVKKALENPVGSDKLCELSKGKNKIVIIGLK